MWSQVPPHAVLSDTFMSGLFQRFDIGPERQAQVRRSLDLAASDWQHAHDGGLSPRELRAQLKLIKRQATALRTMLAAVPAPVWREMIRSSARTRLGTPDEAYLAHDTSPFLDIADEPDPCIVLPGDDLDGSTRILLPELAHACALLAELSDHAQDSNPTVTRGAQIDMPLRRWVQDMQHLWETVLDRKFTRDVNEHGEPITDAACFCVEVYRQMKPGTLHSRVLNEMKIAIQTKRRELEEFRKFGPKLFQR